MEMEGTASDSQPNDDPTPISHESSNWHWLVIIGTAFGTLLEGLIPHSFGTFIANFKSPLNNSVNPSFYYATQFQLDCIPALSSAFPCILLPLFTILIEKWRISYQIFSAISFVIITTSCILSSFVNSWPLLMITYSFLYSLGSSLFLAITIIISAEYFPVKHGFYVLATSLYQIGYPIASLIGNPIVAVLILNYGWKNAFRFIAMIVIVMGLVLSCFLKPIQNKGIFFCFGSKSDSTQPIEGKSENIDLTTKSTFRYLSGRYQIWPWFIGKYINYMCWYGFRTNIITYMMKSTTFGLTKSSALVSIYAAFEIMVALVASLSGDRFRKWLIHIHIIATVSLAIHAGIFTIVLSNYTSAVLLMMGIGISIQLSLSFGYPASVQVWGPGLGPKTGWVLTNIAAGLGILTSPFFSGILMDNYGINSLFYAQCCGWSVQAMLFTLTLVIVQYRKSSSEMKYEEIDD